MTSEPFSLLLAELDAWASADLTACLWWRDDDAGEPCPELETLLSLMDTHATPCGLATIPARAGEPLRETLGTHEHAWVIQHGYAHVNHAPKGSGNGAWELGLHRPLNTVLEDLRRGMLTLSRLFGTHFVPAVVPPWNKIDPTLFPHLVTLGFRGVSASYKRHRPIPPKGLKIADAHCDVLTWKKPAKRARFAGTARCISAMIDHLFLKRTGVIHMDEPTCTLTHHLEMDEQAWQFMDNLLATTNAHPATRWITPAEIWPPTL